MRGAELAEQDSERTRKEPGRWREGSRAQRSAGCGRCWPDGWSGWGRGKMTRLGSQALGSWGQRGPVHIKGVVHWQLARPHPSPISGAVLFDVCVWRSTEHWAALPTRTHTCPSVLPGPAQLPCWGVGHRGGGSQGGARTQDGGEDTGLCPWCLCPGGLSGPELQHSTWENQVPSQQSDPLSGGGN